jgi:tryptophan 2,3-dioxygenase
MDVSYDGLIGVSDLLSLQDGLAQYEAGLVFVVAHQVHELLFKVLLRDLEQARDSLDQDDLAAARGRLLRAVHVMRSLPTALALLETMSAREFRDLRPALGGASALHSVQFREIEFLAGSKRRGHVSLGASGADERLLARLAEPSLWDAFCSLLARRGVTELRALFEEPRAWPEPHELAELLLTFDSAFDAWRIRHLELAERFVGPGPGTGGTTGPRYLRNGLARRLFPRLWQAVREAH